MSAAKRSHENVEAEDTVTALQLQSFGTSISGKHRSFSACVRTVLGPGPRRDTLAL